MFIVSRWPQLLVPLTALFRRVTSNLHDEYPWAKSSLALTLRLLTLTSKTCGLGHLKNHTKERLTLHEKLSSAFVAVILFYVRPMELGRPLSFGHNTPTLQTGQWSHSMGRTFTCNSRPKTKKSEHFTGTVHWFPTIFAHCIIFTVYRGYYSPFPRLSELKRSKLYNMECYAMKHCISCDQSAIGRSSPYYCHHGGCVFVAACLCLLATLRKKVQTDLHEIFREGRQWANEQMIEFWWRSRSRIRSHIATLVRRALAEVYTVPVCLVDDFASIQRRHFGRLENDWNYLS